MDSENDIQANDDHTRSQSRIAVSAPSLDLAKYRALAADMEISDEERNELLRTLWDIMNGFVHHGFDVKNIPAFLPELFEDSSDPGGGAVDFGLEDRDDQT